MLTQFQVRYPTGSLISELLTIYEGKFIVRVSAQVEGVTRATGMAAAETLELAEDRARSRALEVLAIDQRRAGVAGGAEGGGGEAEKLQHLHQVQSPSSSYGKEKKISAEIARNEAQGVAFQAPSFIQGVAPPASNAPPDLFVDPTDSSFSPLTPVEESTPAPAVSPRFKGNDRFTFTPNPSAQEPDAAAENFRFMSDTKNGSTDNPPIPFDNVTPLVPRSYSPQNSSGSLGQTGAETEMVASEPIDLSDAIARTSVELKRLGWSNKEGREYLERTYGKRSRQQLTDEEMLEFLHYLESQPSPNEPFA